MKYFYILNEILEHQNVYQNLDSKPQMLTAKEHRPAYGTDGDYFSKPSADDVFEKRFEPLITEEDTRGPSPYMQFDLKRRKKVKDEEPGYSGRLVDKIPGFKAVTYNMNCWIRETETGNKSLEGTLIMTKENYIHKGKINIKK